MEGATLQTVTAVDCTNVCTMYNSTPEDGPTYPKYIHWVTSSLFYFYKTTPSV
jgi:hypothetical protein